MEALMIRNARWMYALLFVVSIGFFGACFFMLPMATEASERWIAWAGILFSGAGSLVPAWQFFDARPRLTIDESGICDRTLGVGVIPWSEITDAYIKSIHGHDF